MAKQISTARKVGRVVKTVVKSVVAVVLVGVLALDVFGIPALINMLNMPRMINNIMGYEHSWDNSGVDSDGLDLEYYKADYDAWATLRQQLDAGALADIQNNNAYWQQWESPIDTVSQKVYDTMLKGYGQSDGVQSYGTVVDLLVAYY